MIKNLKNIARLKIPVAAHRRDLSFGPNTKKNILKTAEVDMKRYNFYRISLIRDAQYDAKHPNLLKPNAGGIYPNELSDLNLRDYYRRKVTSDFILVTQYFSKKASNAAVSYLDWERIQALKMLPHLTPEKEYSSHQQHVFQILRKEV